jgi:hypothetical protein
MAESKFLAGLTLGSVLVAGIAWLARKKPQETHPKPTAAELPSLTPEQAAPAPTAAPAPSSGASEASAPIPSPAPSEATSPSPTPAPEPAAGAFAPKAAPPVYFDLHL